MTDRGYNNFYTPDEYESYQQCPFDNYGQNLYQQFNYYPLEPYRTPTLEENLMKYEKMTMESVAYTEARKTEARLEDTLIKFMEMQQQHMMSQNQQMQQMQDQHQQYLF
ncbi:hypothetical protein A2U01_0027083 [Trifolium medium]|uniref:Uncharacterized protein n=1 Tax=Trifolium medium TaxID=97028 RepID=A0A392P205_9FABA|nr:hypothetical protein [Trifolium medium]